MRSRSLPWLIAAGVACVWTGVAQATVFDWSYAGAGISAAGVLDATNIGGNVYQITSLSGERNGVAITAISTFAGGDELVYYPASDLYSTGQTSSVDYPGFAYVAGGIDYNAYFDPYFDDYYYCGAVGLCEVNSVDETMATGNAVPLDYFVLTVGVPEPSTWGLMLTGLGGLGAAIRCRRHASRVSPARV
jgi:hypothetical protein